MNILKKLILGVLSIAILSSTTISDYSYALETKEVSKVNSDNTGDSDDCKLRIQKINLISHNDKSNFNIECTNGIVYSFESIDSNHNNILLCSNEKIISNNTVEVSRMYLDNDNNTISDVVTITRSSSGSDIVTRQSYISTLTVIEITASFDWYRSGMFSYVRCSGMAACYSANNHLGVKRFDQSRSEGYISIGPAYAQVDYHFYSTYETAHSYDGKFKITCTDTGSISDNGL